MLAPTLSRSAIAVLVAAGACVVVNGCGASADDASAPADGFGGGGTTDGSTNLGATSIEFSVPELVFVPGKRQFVHLTAVPPGAYPVRLALVGDALDAFLDRTGLDTAEDGTATFSLTAPSSATTFSVRASIGSVTAELAASAGTGDTTNLIVVPAYTGHRKIDGWVGTVSAGGTCDRASSIPPADGDLVSAVAPRPVVSGVPLGTPLRVTVRAGHFAGGCVEVSNVVGDDAGTVGSVSVLVTDRPLSMNDAQLPIRLGVDTSSTWIAGWMGLADVMMESFSPSAGTDGGTLLDAMHDVTPKAAQAAFDLSRTERTWDQLFGTDGLKTLKKHDLRGAARSFIGDALPVLATNLLSGILTAKADPPSTASLALTNVGGIVPSEGGFSVLSSVSWTTAPDDQVLFGGTMLTFAPSKFAAALALGPAKKLVVSATTVPEALASLAGCASLGPALVGSAASGLAYTGCNSDCVVSRCNLAVEAMWARAESAVPDNGSLAFSASAAVTSVTDTASPDSVSGTWVGDVHVGGPAIHVGGTALGGMGAKAP